MVVLTRRHACHRELSTHRWTARVEGEWQLRDAITVSGADAFGSVHNVVESPIVVVRSFTFSIAVQSGVRNQ
jgi:hypothetical protein